MRTPAIALLIGLSFGCRPEGLDQSEPGDAAPPPAAAIAPVRGNMALDEKLQLLDAELRAVIESNLGGDSHERLLRAEAITDRLLESEPPVFWLATQYSSEAKLRQLQALADRILARARRGDDRGVRQDVQQLQREVAYLRRELATPGGGAAPPPLDSLLAAAPTSAVQAATTGGESDTAEEEEESGPPLLGAPLDTLVIE